MVFGLRSAGTDVYDYVCRNYVCQVIKLSTVSSVSDLLEYLTLMASSLYRKE